MDAVTGFVVGKAVEAFIEGAIVPMGTKAGDYIRDTFSRFSSDNTKAVVEKAVAIAQASGNPVRLIPLRTSVPILEGASREDDPGMQERWATLLASAATATNADSVPPPFANTLSQLTPRSAVFFERLCAMLSERKDGVASRGEMPVDVAIALGWARERGEPGWDALVEEVELIVDILVRQTLIEREPMIRGNSLADLVKPIEDYYVLATTYGRAFRRACWQPGRAKGA